MGAAKYDFTIEQGATFSKTFTWKDSTKTAVNLTGYTARMSIKLTKDDTTAIKSLLSTGTSPNITLGGVAGTIIVAMTATETAALNFDKALYDLEMVNGVTITRLLEGDITLSKEVTA